MKRTWHVITLVVVALGLVVAWAVLESLGLRVEVGVLSGTVPDTEEALVGGVLYVLAWFGAVLVAPVLFAAAVLTALWEAVAGRRLAQP